MKKFLWLVVLFFPITLIAADSKPTEFIRLNKENKSLEIAITRYESSDKNLKVDLVGVVHIGDTEYYKELNRRLSKYDVVLYELVAPEGTKPKQKEKSNDILSKLPKVMSAMLDLDMQLSVINYNKKNFVHADMSFEEMKEAAKDRGETSLTIGLSILLDSLKQQNKQKKTTKDVDFVEGLKNPNLLKQQMAEQLASDTEMNSTMKKLLVDDRNKKACDVLDKQIKAGKKSIAIFYGAAHNQDFDKRLRDRKLVYVDQEWLTAWDLTKEPASIEVRLLKLLKD